MTLLRHGLSKFGFIHKRLEFSKLEKPEITLLVLAGPNLSENMHDEGGTQPRLMSSDYIYQKLTFTTESLAIKYTMLFQNRINFLQSYYKWISEIALP